jgi:predicted regulator of Ras-like GTPase activity (Roadblock/LC7/MglB family)
VFKQQLKKVVDNVDGGIAAVVMGLDGIPVESYVRMSDKLDINTVAMEFSFILGQVKKAADSLQVGNCEELTVKAQRLVLCVRMLTPIYFVATALSPEGNIGKARFMMRMSGPSMSAEL